MEETVRITEGWDWCNVQVAKLCLGKLSLSDKCWTLGGQVRICDACVQRLYREDSPEDFVWALEEKIHDGPCEEEPVDIGTEEVKVCPGCMRAVMRKIEESCTCSCHEKSGGCDGNPLVCAKCGSITKIDVIYMTRQQTERHPRS